MEWRRSYSLRSYLRSTMWVVPVAAYIASFFLIRIVGWLDDGLQWSWAWKVDPSTVDSALEGLVAATVSFIVFAFSSLLVAIQIASAQLTPRACCGRSASCGGSGRKASRSSRRSIR